MFANWTGGYSGLLGLPVAGLKVKMEPVGNQWEARNKRPNITPGYWLEEQINPNAFDKEGFYKTGDVVKFAQPDSPAEGLIFDGRLAENFKLSTGTWVNAGMLRIRILSAGAPVVQDAVITGHDNNFVGAILFLDRDACLKATGNLSESQVKNYFLIP